MLTMKAPIELKCANMTVPSGEAFYHKIVDNYGMMTSGITKEDLLHVVTAPPEVYLAEGGMTNLVNTQNIQSHQENKIEIINNLLNRIALTPEVNLTYQDRVYITTMLNKLGIQNVNQFMKQVNRLKQETLETEQLVSLYWNHMEELTELVESYQNMETREGDKTETIVNQESSNLHQSILNRLQTGAIYQILNNFYTNHTNANQYVTGQELQLTEQKRTAVNILLNKMKNVVTEGEVPFVYRHENFYETQNFEETMLTTEDVTSQITSAVLLSLVDNLYLNRFERQVHHQTEWIHAENALYQTAENTLTRMRMEINNQISRDERRQMLAVTQQMMLTREIETIEKLLENREEQVNWMMAEEAAAQYEQPVQTIYKTIEPEALKEQEQPMVTEQEEHRQELRTWYESIWNNYHTNMTEYLSYLRQSPQQILSSVETIYRAQEQTSEENRLSKEVSKSEGSHLSVNNQFTQVIEQWQPKGNVDGNETQLPASVTDQSVLYHQENRNQLLTEEYESRYDQIQRQQELLKTQIEIHKEEQIINQRNVTENQQNIFFNPEDNLELLEQQLFEINQQNVENYHRFQEILRRQETEKQRKSPTTLQRDTKRDSLRALNHPEELLQELQSESSETRESAQERRLQELIKMLPEETRRIYERFEEYQTKARHTGQSEAVTARSLGQLMRDVELVQRDNVRVREEIIENQEVIRETSQNAIERWEERQAAAPNVREWRTQTRNDVSIVHKSTNNEINEEMLSELLEQNRLLKNNVTVNREIFEQQTTVETKTVQQNTTTVVQDQQNINELIQRGVQRQIGSISDQIYSKLERRLQNEKKRRGY